MFGLLREILSLRQSSEQRDVRAARLSERLLSPSAVQDRCLLSARARLTSQLGPVLYVRQGDVQSSAVADRTGRVPLASARHSRRSAAVGHGVEKDICLVFVLL